MFKRKLKTELTPDDLTRQVDSYRERCDFLTVSVRTLFFFVKEFSLDLKEIDSDAFKKKVDDLATAFKADESTRDLARAFESRKGFILDFIGKEKTYLDEREKELTGIIQMLHDALGEMANENQQFNQQMNERNLRMERITYLDDIRKMRDSLRGEISQMREVIRQKQRTDMATMDSLAREVDSLKTSLQKVKDASVTDALTGAYNRLGFDMYIQRMTDRNLVEWQQFSLLMCDIDNFKVVNDTHGHQVGDGVLKAFVKECRNFVREDDFVGRYGGEEFVVALPGVNLRQAVKRARAICERLASKRYGINYLDPDETISFTVSIGVTVARKNDTPQAIIERADAALYYAKRSGKNQAVSDRDVKPIAKLGSGSAAA